jgi:hypothetical protein
LREALDHSQDAWNEWNDLRHDVYSIPRTLPAHEWSQVRGQLGLAVLPAIETWLADSEAFERQARAADRVGRPRCPRPAHGYSPPAPRRCPPRAPRQRTADR